MIPKGGICLCRVKNLELQKESLLILQLLLLVMVSAHCIRVNKLLRINCRFQFLLHFIVIFLLSLFMPGDK